MRQALSKHMADYFDAQENDLRAAADIENDMDDRTFGDAYQAMMDVIGLEYSVDRDDILRAHKRSFLCEEVLMEDGSKPSCWTDYFRIFDVKRNKAEVSRFSEEFKTRMLETIPKFLRDKLDTFACNAANGFRGKADSLMLDVIMNVCRDNWKRKQKLEGTTVFACPSGKPVSECTCKVMAPLSSSRAYPPSCNGHQSVPDDVWKQIVAAAKDTGVKRFETSPAWGRWCQHRGICEMCWHVKDQREYDSQFPGARSRSQSRQPSSA